MADYAAFEASLRDGIAPSSGSAFQAQAIAIGAIMLVGSLLSIVGLTNHRRRGTLWLAGVRDGRWRFNGSIGINAVSACFGLWWTVLAIVWTYQDITASFVRGSLALLVGSFATGSFLLTALLLAMDTLLPRRGRADVMSWSRLPAMAVYVFQPLAAIAFLIGAVYVEHYSDAMHANFVDIVASLEASQAAGTPFESAMVSAGELLVEMAANGTAMLQWAQAMLALGLSLGLVWLVVYAPLSLLLLRMHDRRYRDMRQAVRAQETLERRGDLALAPGGVATVHLGSGLDASGSRPFARKGLDPHRHVISEERKAHLARLVLARRWIAVKTIVVQAVAVAFISSCGWLCVQAPHLTAVQVRVYSMTIFGWPYALLALASQAVFAYDSFQTRSSRDLPSTGHPIIQVEKVHVEVRVPPLPYNPADNALTESHERILPLGAKPARGQSFTSLDLEDLGFSTDRGEVLRQDTNSLKTSVWCDAPTSVSSFSSGSPTTTSCPPPSPSTSSWRPSDVSRLLVTRSAFHRIVPTVSVTLHDEADEPQVIL